MAAEVMVRKYVRFEDEIHRENGREITPPLTRVVVGAVVRNPLAGRGSDVDLAPLVQASEELGADLTSRALETLGSPQGLRAYGKAALIGTDGDLEHGAALIHPRLGMAMRSTLRRGKVLIPGNAKVVTAGTPVDLLLGPLDQGWDLDAMDCFPVLIHDGPRPDEFVLLVGFATGPRPNARSAGPTQAEVDALIETFD